MVSRADLIRGRSKETPADTLVSVRIPQDLIQRVMVKAEENGWSKSDAIRVALFEWLGK